MIQGYVTGLVHIITYFRLRDFVVFGLENDGVFTNSLAMLLCRDT